MRFAAIVIGIGLTTVACGGSSGSSTATLPAPATTGPTTSTTVDGSMLTPSTTTPNTTTSVVSATTEPGMAPNGEPMEIRRGLSIEQALLPDEALPPPWEPQWRLLDQPGYGAGPNQTNCDVYWALEELRGGGGGHAMWWIDGGNANHYVRRIDRSNVDSALGLGAIAERCPTVRWLEGGSFTVESVDLDHDAVGLKLTDEVTGDVTWFAMTVFGDLLSVIDVPLWTNVEGEMVGFDRDELNRLVSLMYERLQSADTLPLPTTTTIAPPTLVPATTAPPTTTNPTPLPTTTVPPAVTGLGKLLLERGELPAGFAEPEVRAHRPDDPDPELVAICPAAESVDRIDAMLTWSSTAERERVEIDQIIGRAESAAEASEVVLLFGEMAECELSEMFGEATEASGGVIDIAGADAATSLVVEPTDGSFLGEIIAVAIDDVVMVVSAGTTFEAEWVLEPPLDLDLTDAVAESAVAKVRAATS